MTQIAHSDIDALTDRLAVVGARYRVQRVVRGGVIWVGMALATLVVAGLAAHATGAGTLAKLIGLLTLGAIGMTAVWQIAWPLLRRPRREWVARLVERRVDGLHNGLTNALLLSARDDVAASPFTPMILSEIRRTTEQKSLDEAVTIAELKPVFWRSGIVFLVSATVAILAWSAVSHGWRQMLAPSAFVPKSGAVIITSVRPGDATVIKGQPVEIVVEASGLDAKDPQRATLIFDAPLEGKTQSDIPSVAEGRFAARLEHVDAALKYRVEIGGTQSRWYTVKVIDQIKLESLSLQVQPPAYSKQPAQTVKVADQPINVTAGSTLTATARVDTGVSAALLQLDELPPLTMTGKGQDWSASFTLNKDASMAVLLTDPSGQILARLPDSPVLLRVTLDAPPKIEARWPKQTETLVPLDQAIEVTAHLSDDFGLTRMRVLMSMSSDAPMMPVFDQPLDGQTQYDLSFKPTISPDVRKHGSVIRLRIEAVDNRDVPNAKPEALGPQTAQSPEYQVRFEDAKQITKESAERLDKLREALRAMLKSQQDLHTKTVALKGFADALQPITLGQTVLRDRMKEVADTFKFEAADAQVQKVLLMLANNPAQEAVDLSTSLTTEPAAEAQKKLHGELQARQRRIISTLESLLAMLVASPEPTEQQTKKGGDLPNHAEELAKLKAALEEYMKQQQKILDTTTNLAKKPVDDFTDKDKKTLDELVMSQEKLDAFMQQKLSDFSKLAEQDMANASMLKELMEVYSEVTMAKDALKKKEIELAVSLEESGLELAKEITSNLEKWLMDTPDRIKWDMEDPVAKTDTPMAELPEQLEDMIGELMEQQEDLFEAMEDTNANWTDSLDKGAGWDAADGPIANMSAKGVTGNALPNDNEMGGRSGEGRSGKSQGEFVEETATGKGGRNTPTRLDPTPFQQGQVKDTSKDPVGGATGGGKVSGQGGEGLEGPVPPGMQKDMQRLAQKQAQLRNSAERINLQYQLGKYDQFKLLESIAIMRRTEADLNANRYQNAMRRRDVMLDAMDTSRMLTGGEVHVEHDTSPTLNARMEDQIHDAKTGDLPPAWSEPLKAYYEKLGRQ